MLNPFSNAQFSPLSHLYLSIADGCEPSSCRFKSICAAGERVKGIEPSSVAWKATALPLSYTRVWLAKLEQALVPAKCFSRDLPTSGAATSSLP
jgi:hypothetical protein